MTKTEQHDEISEISEVVDHLRTVLEDTDRKKLSGPRADALGYAKKIDRPSRINTIVQSRHDIAETTWELLDISAIDGCGSNEYLAAEVHRQQRGERYTVPIALGVGEIEITPRRMPSVEKMRGHMRSEREKESIHIPTEESVAEIRDEIIDSTRAFTDMALEGNAHEIAFNGSTVFVEPDVSRWEGFKTVFDDLGLTAPQQKVIMDAGSRWSYRPKHIKNTGSYSFAADVSFS